MEFKDKNTILRSMATQKISSVDTTTNSDSLEVIKDHIDYLEILLNQFPFALTEDEIKRHLKKLERCKYNPDLYYHYIARQNEQPYEDREYINTRIRIGYSMFQLPYVPIEINQQVKYEGNPIIYRESHTGLEYHQDNKLLIPRAHMCFERDTDDLAHNYVTPARTMEGLQKTIGKI